jgi:uncharacterized phage protein (TIGR01671 family)
MTREIRFRAWDGSIMWENIGDLDVHKSHGDIIMQYTGLKDRNNKDVYEGDILQYTGKKANIRGPVIYKNGKFSVRIGDSDRPIDLCVGIPSFLRTHIFIGNLYENQDLLPTKS